MLSRMVLATLALLLAMAACNKAKQSSDSTQQPANASQPSQQQAANLPQQAPQPQQPPPVSSNTNLPQSDVSPERKATTTGTAKTSKPPAQSLVIPAGTPITVRLSEAIDVKTSKPGDTFSGTVARSVVVHGTTIIPDATPVSGTVVEATAPGRFSGAGKLSIRLNRITLNGASYPITTSAVASGSQGKGKRSAVMIGGGTGAGALIGGLAGGGKGAAIGALVGGGGGTAGAALTGNKALAFPAESAVTFKIQRATTLKNGPSEATEESQNQAEPEQ